MTTGIVANSHNAAAAIIAIIVAFEVCNSAHHKPCVASTQQVMEEAPFVT
jgi:hypothetical protein